MVFDNAVVVLELSVAAGLVGLDIAGVRRQLAARMGGSRTPVVWLALMEPVEQVGLIAPGIVVNDLGTVVEVGFEAEADVARLEQEGQAVPVVGKVEGLDVVVE